jgi:hypothetical protein
MDSRIKEELEKQGYNRLYLRLIISLIILGLVLIGFLVYYFVYYEKSCKDEECFKNAFENCKRVNFIKEDTQATWLYQIIGRSERSKCFIKVTLIALKKGSIENQVLEQKSMLCNVIKDNALKSETDLNSCTGVLKEEMQKLIIQKMHNYLLKNIKEIKEEFNKL